MEVLGKARKRRGYSGERSKVRSGVGLAQSLTGGNVWRVAQGERGTGQAILDAADGAPVTGRRTADRYIS